MLNGVEFGTEAINTVPAWLTRPIQNWSISAVVADVELCWDEGFSDAVRWILGFWSVEEFLHLGRQYRKCESTLASMLVTFQLLHPCLSYPHLVGGNSFSWALLTEEVSAQRMDRLWTERVCAVQNTAAAMYKVLQLPVEGSRGNHQSRWRKRKARETWRDYLLAQERTKPNVFIHWACWLSTISILADFGEKSFSLVIRKLVSVLLYGVIWVPVNETCIFC